MDKMKTIPENKSNFLLYIWLGFQIFPILLMLYLWHLALNHYDLPLSTSKEMYVSSGLWNFHRDLNEGLATANGMFIIAFFLSILVYFIQDKKYGVYCTATSFTLFILNFIIHYNLID